MSVKLSPTVTMWTRREWGALSPSNALGQHSGTVREVFIHHTTDKAAMYMDTLAEQKSVMRGIQRYHMFNNGWSDIGYAYVIFQAYGDREYARVFEARSMQHVPAAQLGHNNCTLPICVVGNFDVDTVKRSTRHAIEVLIRERCPTARTVGGHRDVVSTSCPGDHLYAAIPTIADATSLRLYKTA